MSFPIIPASALPQHPEQTIFWAGLNGCGDALALATTIRQEKRLLVIVTPDHQTALRLEHELTFFLDNSLPILHFPDWETLPYDVFSPLPEIISERLRTLVLLPDTRRGALIVSVATLMHRLDAISHSLNVSSTLIPSNQNEVDRLHAFRLLAHSEIEEYLESLAKKAVEVSRAKSAAGILTHTSHHLLVSLQVRRIRESKSITRFPDFNSAHAMATLIQVPSDLNEAFKSHEDAIRINNGLKSANVKKMFIPIGYRDDFFEIGLLDKLDEFGELNRPGFPGDFRTWKSHATLA